MQQVTDQEKLDYLNKLSAFADNCHRAKDWDMTVKAYEEMLLIHEDPRVLMNLGMVYHQNNLLSMAIKKFNRALELNPRSKEACLILADSQQETGHPLTALHLRQRALSLASGNHERVTIEAANMFLYTVLGTQQDYFAKMTEFCNARLRHLYPKAWPAPEPVNGRKIRLGYISADFSIHTVMFLLWPLISGYDRDGFEVYFYSNSAYSDAKTEEVKALGNWRNISGMTDRQAYATVKGDQLDLLVDLSGYSAGHRLSLLARKPAPRIATGLGFITPIGSPMIDYALLDPWMLPADLAHLIPEKSAGIKTNLYFSPGEEMPLESQEREHIVFGSGNALYKMTAPVVKLWSEVLKRVPGSVLSLKSKTLTDPGVQLLVAARFAEHGIGQDRLRFTGTTTRREHMQWYSSVDICLDPFPYQGGYTTLESLYMGCPVISLNAGGISTTIGALSLCGLDTYIANSPNEYVALACSLGMMLQSLSAESRMKIREHVRQSLQASVIMDGKAFTEDIEAAYRRICA
jgi:predicted O-linked N-acetylglucosamine transferase (SPINDLY family)